MDVDGLPADVDGLLVDVDGLLADVDGLLAGVDGLLASVDGLLADVDRVLADGYGDLRAVDNPFAGGGGKGRSTFRCMVTTAECLPTVK